MDVAIFDEHTVLILTKNTASIGISALTTTFHSNCAEIMCSEAKQGEVQKFLLDLCLLLCLRCFHKSHFGYKHFVSFKIKLFFRKISSVRIATDRYYVVMPHIPPSLPD